MCAMRHCNWNRAIHYFKSETAPAVGHKSNQKVSVSHKLKVVKRLPVFTVTLLFMKLRITAALINIFVLTLDEKTMYNL